MPGNTGPDGVAIFYDTNKFTLINFTSYVINVVGVPTNQVSLILVLKCKNSGQIFIVCTTHLKARKSEILSKFRREQSFDLLSFITDFMDANFYDKNQTPILITGDFNGEKDEPFHQIMTQNLASAYDHLLADAKSDEKIRNGQNSCSNWTRRVNEEETKQTIDYIFYDANLIKMDALLSLSSNQLKSPIPNANYPSDHLSIGAKISFL